MDCGGGGRGGAGVGEEVPACEADYGVVLGGDARGDDGGEGVGEEGEEFGVVGAETIGD